MARLRVDMVACEGVGQCALVAPGLVELDRWGYPVLLPVGSGSRADARGDDAAARRAVRACPRHALWLQEARRPGAPGQHGA